MAGRTRAVLCTRCRQLISPDEPRCPFCGAAAPRGMNPAGGLARLADLDWTEALTYTCVVLYVLSIGRDRMLGLPMQNAFDFFNPSMGSLYLLGMTGGEAWERGAWWTLLTACVLHGGILHIWFNMSFFRSIGPIVREIFGAPTTLFLFFATGVCGNLASNFLFHPPSVGASGAIFGFMGALIGHGLRRGGTWGRHLSRTVWGWALPNLVIGCILPFVNNSAHIGGLLSGLVLGAVLPTAERRTPAVVSVLGLLMLVATAAGVIASLLTMGPVAAAFEQGL